MAWYIYLTISVAVILIHQFWTRRNLPPGPWGIPIFGYLFWIDPKAPHLTLSKLVVKYGPIYGLWMGSVYTIVVTDVKMIKSLFVLDSTTGRAPLYLTHGIMKGYGLICAQGELWKEHRKFTCKCLRQLGGTKMKSNRGNMINLITDHVKEFIGYVEKNAGVSIDPLEYLRHSLGSIMCSIVYGKTWEKNDEEWVWMQELQEEGTKQIGIAGPLNFLPFLRFIPKYQRLINYIMNGKNKTHEVYQKIIHEQTKQAKHMNDFDRDVENIVEAFLVEKSKRSEDEASKFYNDQQFHHLLADIFGAGLDTTLTTLRWYLLYMAKNPSIQGTIRSEIRDNNLDGISNLEAVMAHSPLLEASIYETQRIRSVVPVGIPHGTLNELEVAGYRIPKGTMIVPLQWAIHMDERTWKDPETFNPWRFIDNKGRVVKPENFIPFQFGKRICVGDELARMLLFQFAATIIQKFSLSLENENTDLTGDCGITLTPKPHKIIFNEVYV